MAKSRVQEDEITVFNNMSFLDVFCCTVGALIFILFIQTLRTRNMVERRELAAIQTAQEKAKKQAAEATTRRDQALTDAKDAEQRRARAEEEAMIAKRQSEDAEQRRAKAEEEARIANRQRDDAEKKAKEADSRRKDAETVAKNAKDREEKLRDQLAEIGKRKAPPTTTEIQQPLTNTQVAGSGGAIETQKTARGQFLLGNLETRSIVCAGEGLYFGMSRKVVSIRDPKILQQVFRQFLRFHDAKQEGLWRTIWGDGSQSYAASIQLQRSEQAHIGKGLLVQKDENYARAQALASSRKMKIVELDVDNDDKPETQYEDSDSDGILDVKRVNVDDDAFFEEVYLNYDAATNQWGRLLADTEGDNVYDVLYLDQVLSDTDYEVKLVMPHLKSGNSVFRYEDTDNDGIWDVKYENIDLTNKVWEKTYLGFDVRRQRWGGIVVDADGNGKPDVLWRDTDMSNDDWEEKLVDVDQDGKWDIRWIDRDPRDNDWELRMTEPEAAKGDTVVWKRCEVDSDGDGAFDVILRDTNGDGEFDEELVRDSTSGKWEKKKAE